jgi:DnaJ-like protein
MTERKPPGVSVETWVEKQIREAQERGDFDNLPGSGKPLPKRGGDTMDWVAQKLREENVDATGLLPPSLAIPKEIEQLPARLARERSAGRVREIVEDLNARIRAALTAPQVGPPLRARPLDVDEVVSDWRAGRG